MVRKLGLVALFLGAFLIVLAALSKFYMYDHLAVVPLNTKTTSISATAAGADGTYLDVAAGAKVVTGPLKSTRVVVGNVKASKAASKELGRDIAVWDTYSCTDAPTFDCGAGETPLSGTVDTVAFDAHSGETVAWKGTKSDTGGETTSPMRFEGLYFKFPFNTQKKDYKFWDGTLKKATTVKYLGEGTVKGLKIYKFAQTIAPTKTGTIDVPGDLVGSKKASVTADRIYSNVRSFSVEPVTGVIIVGGESQDAYLEDKGVRGATTTKAKLVYTDKNTANTVKEYKPKVKLLGLIKNGIPIGGGIVGIILLVLGGVALSSNGSAGTRKSEPADLDS